MQITKRDVFVGMAGGFIFGFAVLLLNGGHELAWVAAVKQFVVSFFVSVFVVRFAEWSARRMQKLRLRQWQVVCIGGLPAIIIAIGGAYLVHQLRGTPEPLLSVLPQMVVSPPSLWFFAWRAIKN